MTLNRPKLKQLAISKIPLFQNIPDEERAQLCELLILKEYPKGTSIFLSDQPGKDIMFVADGTVDVKRSNTNGKEVILSRLGVGEFFGEIALLTGSTRSADVTASEDCMVLILESTHFESILSTNHGFTKALLIDLASRVSAASTRIADLALLDVYCRVFRILKTMAKKDSKDNSLKVLERPTHKDLAAMVGTSREIVTRAMTKLVEDEILEVTDKEILILRELSIC